ncbi:major allergen I polypeptide chain 1-like [Psammomys obesus]|uniref:major allergen I polypeptide chain 1-like n=1 Tax=Psammomys obesus TaxID=48139 RepID=UPI0024535D16|nr:major allergen I polypeptide chain 1-like [Psammomys obesus]
MKFPSALLVLGAALLLTSGGNCGICPLIEKDLELFLLGSSSDYMAFVKNYQHNDLVLDAAKGLKDCVCDQLTQEAKQFAFDFLKRIFASDQC